jgi:hypothetical protein
MKKRFGLKRLKKAKGKTQKIVAMMMFPISKDF